MVALLKRFLFLVLVAAPLAACETPDPGQEFADLTFGHMAPLNFNAGSLRVVSQYIAPLAAPNVDHLFPVKPEQALRNWAVGRLKAQGGTGTIRFTIVDASVRETRLKLKKGLTGTFTKEQSSIFDASLEVVVEALDERGYQRAYATVRVARSRTIQEGATINERRRLWFGLTEALMQDFNRDMEKNIRTHLSGYLL